MPPKKSKQASSDPQGFTPERFDKELQGLASKAKSDAASASVLGQITVYARAIILLSLLGVYSNVSQLALSPVFGGIPSGLYHHFVLMAGCFLGWAGNLALRELMNGNTASLLPLVAAYVPMAQFFMYTFSEKLGAHWGPLATEALTLFPLCLLTAASVADCLESARFGALPGFVADAAPGFGSWGIFKLAEKLSGAHIRAHVGTVFLYTRVGMEMLLAAAYAVFSPSKLLVLTIPALIHTAVWNTHVMTPQATTSLNNTMLAGNWSLLDRQESLTGYVSVMESYDSKFRVMRCDHSLLGGIWTMYQGGKVQEPIYGVFVMLEAVRLVQPLPSAHRPVDKDAKALVIGLGVGTTPSALVTHGIDTIVVEIDPVVHEYAAKYFSLKENNPAVLQDAVSYTASLVEQGAKFDYIVHDVFTGGAEPVDLFTLEFLQGLYDLLTPNGVIAINYAGDFILPAPKTVVRTITSVFPSCRIFRESPMPDKSKEEAEHPDFTNMVIFCHKHASPLTFRRAKQADFLETHSRRRLLEPQYEVQALEFLEGDSTGLLTRNDTEKMVPWHKSSAVGHWNIMRTVLPAHIWEMW